MDLKNWEKRGKRGLTRAAARALRARGRAGEPPDLATFGRILVIRQQNQLGDMLLTTPVFRAMRQHAPHARIDLMAAPQNADAVLGNAHLDQVITYDKAALLRRPAAAARFLRALRSAAYDLVIVQSTVSFSVTSVWLAAASRARRRAGRPGPGGRGADIARDIFHWCLPEPVPGRHQTAVNLDLLAPFGVSPAGGDPEIFLTAAEQAAGGGAARRAFGEGDGTRILIHPGAGKKPNRWPADRFGALAGALLDAGHRVALASGPSEVGLLAAMERAADRRLRRVGPLSFRELAGAMRAADLLIANDTGVLHLGAAAGVRVLTLFGPTDPLQWCPARDTVRYLHAPGGDLEQLAFETVRDAALPWAASAGTGEECAPGTQPAPRMDP